MKRYTHRWRVSTVLLVSMMLLMTSGPGVARDNQAEFETMSWANPCLLYGTVETPRQNAWLFAIDLAEEATQLLGEALPKAHVSGLAVHPDTGELVALVVNQTGPKVTTLARVDVATGAMTPIGETEMDFGEGLSFRPTDATLWAWWREHGLVRIDPETAAVELVLAGDLAVSALSWDPTGAVLYLAGNRSLWKFKDGDETFQLILEPLPVLVGGLAMRGDGQLLLTAAAANAAGLDLLVFDPTTGAVVAHFGAPAVPMETGRREDEAAAFIKALTWPVACGNPSPGGEAELIQSIQIDKLEVCPGETIHVQVEAVHPEGGGNPVLVSIDGLPGNDRFLQLDGAPGPRMINVSAWTAEGYADRESRTVEVLDCGPPEPFARLFVGLNPFHPYTVDFKVVNADEIAPLGAQYEWEFGDGVVVDTDVPFVSHSYEDALQPDEEYASFDAAVTVQLPDGTALWTPETVVIWNHYAANRERGLIQPATTNQPELVLSGSQLTGDYTLRNLEDVPLTLTGQQIEQQPCDPAQDPLALPWEELSLTIGPGEQWMGTLVLDAAAVPEDVCGVALHIVGEAGTGEQVAADLYFQVQRNALLAQPETDEPTLTMLNDVAAQGLVPDPDYITDEDLYLLSHQGQVVIPPSTAAAASRSLAQAAMAAVDETDCDGDAETPNPIGCECMSGDLPPEDLPENVGSISCQATEAFDRYPPHIANALKGDVILVGGCGFVGQMLRQLEPPQNYTHTGIMTKNYVEIAHSTSTSDRYNEHIDRNILSLNFMGFDDEVLKYGWPGMIREDVTTAFSRKQMTDPFGDAYWLIDFLAEPGGCNGSVVPPLVVKPPAAKAWSVRPMLRTAADIAAAMSTRYPEDFNDPNSDHYRTGHGHYRLGAYSDGAIAMDESKEHPAGEPATVCSSFVWYSLKQAGATLEDGLDNADVQRGDILKGAELDEQTADGLYLYSREERLNAGQFMWDYVHNAVVAEMGWKEWFFSDVPHWLANQFVNCFGLDACAAADRKSQLWKDTGAEGRTVSPDNILLWDPPTDDDNDGEIDHGVYGYSERMVYRSGGWKRVYRWAPSEGTGSVKGTVTYEGQPMQGATVILNAAGGLTTASGPNGKFRFHAVPAGFYDIEAQKQLPGVFLSSRDQTVTIVQDGTASVELVLLPPAEDFRRVIFEDNLYHSGGQEPDPEHDWPHYHGFLHEDWDWGAMCSAWDRWEINDIVDGEGQLSCQVDPYYTPVKTFWWQHCLGDSCVTINGTCTLEPSTKAVWVILNGSLGDASGSWSRFVPAGASAEIELHLEDDNWCLFFREWDKATLWLKLTNVVQSSAVGQATQSVEGADAAEGAWPVEIKPIPITDTPAFSGKGDAVSGAFAPPAPGVWNVSHDGLSHFVVTLHCAGGSELVQDAMGPVSESVMIDFPEGPCRWEVEADGNWVLAPHE